MAEVDFCQFLAKKCRKSEKLLFCVMISTKISTERIDRFQNSKKKLLFDPFFVLEESSRSKDIDAHKDAQKKRFFRFPEFFLLKIAKNPPLRFGTAQY